jgi:hypothetical protein
VVPKKWRVDARAVSACTAAAADTGGVVATGKGIVVGMVFDAVGATEANARMTMAGVVSRASSTTCNTRVTDSLITSLEP